MMGVIREEKRSKKKLGKKFEGSRKGV